MKILKQLFFICLLIGLSYSISAQDYKFKPGYYITNRNDTVSGFFHINNKMSKPYSFKYKNNLEEKEYLEIHFSGYNAVVIGNNRYVPWFGKRGMSYISKIDFALTDLGKSITETIPLREVYNGNRFSLFHFYDVTDHFFIGEGDNIQELMISYKYLTDWERHNYFQNPPLFIKIATFQSQLMALMGKDLTKKQKDFIESCSYEMMPLIRTIKKMEGKKK